LGKKISAVTSIQDHSVKLLHCLATRTAEAKDLEKKP